MKKLLVAIMVVAMAVVFSGGAFANDLKGQKIIKKNLKEACGMTGNDLAQKHTQDEWKEIFDSGKLPEEIKTICPKSEPLKDSAYEHVFDFLYNYASDSGAVPSC